MSNRPTKHLIWTGVIVGLSLHLSVNEAKADDTDGAHQYVRGAFGANYANGHEPDILDYTFGQPIGHLPLGTAHPAAYETPGLPGPRTQAQIAADTAKANKLRQGKLALARRIQQIAGGQQSTQTQTTRPIMTRLARNGVLEPVNPDLGPKFQAQFATRGNRDSSPVAIEGDKIIFEKNQLQKDPTVPPGYVRVSITSRQDTTYTDRDPNEPGFLVTHYLGPSRPDEPFVEYGKTATTNYRTKTAYVPIQTTGAAVQRALWKAGQRVKTFFKKPTTTSP